MPSINAIPIVKSYYFGRIINTEYPSDIPFGGKELDILNKIHI